MERLTTRNIARVAVYKNPFECEQCGKAIWRLPDYGSGSPTEKLADYEDAEEHGLLLRLPCKEAYTKSGDIVYLIYDYEVVECTHCGLGINPVDGKAYIALATDEDIFPYRRPIPEYDLDPTDWCTNTIDVEVGEIGKIVFLTKEKAEAKLKEMEGAE